MFTVLSWAILLRVSRLPAAISNLMAPCSSIWTNLPNHCMCQAPISSMPSRKNLAGIFLDEEDGVRRNILASRAFVSPDAVARLNGIVHPVLIEQLSLRILDPVCCTVSSPRYPFAVVEVSAPTGFEDAFGLADEILVISAPLAVRRERAIHRGMESSDFDARSACQPDEASLCNLATTVIDNAAGDNSLFEQLDAWLARHGFGDVADKEEADA